jgi:hypothetical protein
MITCYDLPLSDAMDDGQVHRFISKSGRITLGVRRGEEIRLFGLGRGVRRIVERDDWDRRILEHGGGRIADHAGRG